MTNFLLREPDIVFIHIPKTGGSSIQGLWGGRVAQRAFGHLPDTWETLPSLAIIRHPIARFMSAFKMFKYGTTDLEDYYSQPRMPELTIMGALDILEDETIGFDRSVRDIKSNLKHHLIHQTHQFNCLDKAKNILRTETLEDEFPNLAQKFKVSGTLPHIRRTDDVKVSNLETPNDNELERLYSIFSEDFHQLGYELKSNKIGNINLNIQQIDNCWDEWPAFYCDAPIMVGDADKSLPKLDCSLDVFVKSKVKCDAKGTWPGREKNLITHFQKLQPEFGGKSRLSHLLACCIVVIRRTKGSGPGLELFHRILNSYAETIVAEVNLRWLTSICDTLADFGESDNQKLTAFNGTLLANTVKLYETELRLFYPDRPWPPSATFHKHGELFDGVISYWTEGGDMIENMIERLDKLLKIDRTAGLVVGELVLRLIKENTVFHRFAEIAGQPAGKLVKPHINERLQTIFSRHL